jgi:hypothetical protein
MPAKKFDSEVNTGDASSRRVGSFVRSSFNSRASGSFNIKNLSISVPKDEPGTDYNPSFKTPASVLEGEEEGGPSDEPAIKPHVQAIAAQQPQN